MISFFPGYAKPEEVIHVEKPSPLVVPGVEKYLSDYKEEIAHEFGIHFSQGQLENQAKMHNVTDKLVKNKRNEKDGEC